MCGLAGIVAVGSWDDAYLPRLQRALMHLADRGPDGASLSIDREDATAFAHSHLRIRASGHGHLQPATSTSGNVSLVFNGEIYNLRVAANALGVELKQADSEAQFLADAIDDHPLDVVLSTIDGMFALAAWRRDEHTLYLARDPFGEKPLYFGLLDSSVAFGSTPQAVLEIQGCPGNLDQLAISSVLVYGFALGHHSIFSGVRRVEPGTYLRVRRVRMARFAVEEVVYFDALEVRSQVDHGVQHDVLQAIARCVRRRAERVQRSAIMLSGGIDSAVVAALAREHTHLTAFTLAWPGSVLDESDDTARIASYLDVPLEVVRLDDSEILGLVERVLRTMPEPHGDSSQISSAAVAEYVSRHSKVVLTGDGGDEFFGGYSWVCPADERAPAEGVCTHRWSSHLARMPEQPVIDADPTAYDLKAYLPCNNLAKLDHTTMRVGLEGRAGLVSPELARSAWAVRADRGPHGKSYDKPLLRAALARHLPANLHPAVKKGFQAPVWTWLDGPLRTWMEDILSTPAAWGSLPISAREVRHRMRVNWGLGDGHWLWGTLVLVHWLNSRARLGTVG